VPRTAILSDIHANLHALEAVLTEVDAAHVDELVFGGDTVGYGANPAECVARVIERGGRSVLGNHDLYTVETHSDPSLIPPKARESNPVWAGVAHAVHCLSPEQIRWLAMLPHSLPIGREILAHSALHQPGQWPYLHSPRDAKPTLEILRKNGSSLGFFGHTHQQDLFAHASAPEQPQDLGEGRFLIPEGAVCAAVVGSVGQPRGHDDFRAGWVIWDSEARVLEFRRTDYPALGAASAILAAGLPPHSAQRLLREDQLAEFEQLLR
jgi:hypothetical protein